MKTKIFDISIILLIISIIFISCDNKTQMEEREITLKSGAQYQLQNSTNKESVIWTTDNYNIAYVDNQGLLTARLMGETYVYTNKNVDKYKVIVEPRHNYFVDPCLNWGAPKEEVYNYMNTFQFYKESDTNLSYISCDDYTLMYGYTFEDEQLVQSAIGAYLHKKNEIKQHLEDRYIVLDYDETEKTTYMIDPLDIHAIIFLETEDAIFIYYCDMNYLYSNNQISNKNDLIKILSSQKYNTAFINIR